MQAVLLVGAEQDRDRRHEDQRTADDAVASGGTGRALQAVPPADRDRVAHVAHHAFITGFNTIALVGVAVAAVGSVAGYALVRSRDFVGPGAPATAPPERARA